MNDRGGRRRAVRLRVRHHAERGATPDCREGNVPRLRQSRELLALRNCLGVLAVEGAPKGVDFVYQRPHGRAGLRVGRRRAQPVDGSHGGLESSASKRWCVFAWGAQHVAKRNTGRLRLPLEPHPRPLVQDGAGEHKRVGEVLWQAETHVPEPCDEPRFVSIQQVRHRSHALHGQVSARERLLDEVRLTVVPVKDRDVSEREVRLLVQTFDEPRDPRRGVLLRREGVRVRCVASGVVRLQRGLAHALVARDELLGGSQDGPRRTVVFVQLDDGGAHLLPQSSDPLGARPAPRVDALVFVTNGGDVVGRRGEKLQQLVLRLVDVLILVDEHVAELRLILRQDGCVRL